MQLLTEFKRTARCGELTEARICALLGIRDVPLIRPQDLPSYLRRCHEQNGALAVLVAFWLLHQMVRRRQLDSLFDKETVDWFLAEGIVQETEPDLLTAAVDLYPCLGVYVFTDPLLARTYQDGHVYQLGTDSYALARITPRKQGERALDLCTGSGIHAILAALHHDESFGVDLNPRALAYSKRNAVMNEVDEKCHFLEGDLYGPVSGQFDLITANPPFVPTPDTDMLIHRTGGETGEVISERLVAGLPEHLAPGGTFSMILDFPVMRDTTYLQRIQTWLGGTPDGPVPGWGIAVLNFGHVSREQYIKEHVDDTADDYFQMYERYLQSYDRLGIVEVGFGNVFVRRLPDGHPGFSAERFMVTPHISMGDAAEHWLEALERIHDPSWSPDWDGWKPTATELVADSWVNSRGDKGIVEYRDYHWSGPAQRDGATVELLRRCDGTRTAGELAGEDRPGAATRLKALLELLAIR